MLKSLKILMMVTFTVIASSAHAVDAVSCLRIYSETRLQHFSDVANMNSVDAIWAQAKKELRTEISSLTKTEQEEIIQAAEGIQKFVDVLGGRSIKWKAANGTKENYIVYNYRGRMDDLKEDLRVGLNSYSYGTHANAVGIYKNLFHDVESSYLSLSKNLAEMSTLEKYARTAESIQKHRSLQMRLSDYVADKIRGPQARARLEQLRNENRQYFRWIGRGIEEYTIVRLYLENIAKEDPVLLADPVFSEMGHNGQPLAPPAEIAAYARNILSQLGVTGVEQRSAFLNTPKLRISLDELHGLMARTPEIQIEKLQYEVESNRSIFFRSTAVIVFGNYIRKIVTKFPQQGKFRMVRQALDMMTGLIERRYLEHRYLPQIMDIVYAENDIQVQYEILRRQHDAEETTDEFLVTFARISYYSAYWSNLRVYAEKVAATTGSAVDKDFVERMKKAETEAVKALTFSPGKSDTKASLMKLGSVGITAGLIAYQYDHIVNFFLGTFGLVTTATKFVCAGCGL